MGGDMNIKAQLFRSLCKLGKIADFRRRGTPWEKTCPKLLNNKEHLIAYSILRVSYFLHIYKGVKKRDVLCARRVLPAYGNTISAWVSSTHEYFIGRVDGYCLSMSKVFIPSFKDFYLMPLCL